MATVEKSALDILQGFRRPQNQTITVKDDNGDEQTFIVKRYTELKDYLLVGKHVQKRIEAMKMLNGKLAVVVPKEMLEPFIAYFPDAVAKDEATYEFYLTEEGEINIATGLEQSVISPAFDWKTACIYIRVNGMLATALAGKINELNTEIAFEDAKNDSGQTVSGD